MNNSREKFEEFLAATFGDIWNVIFTEREINHMSLAWQASTEQSQKEIEALQAREKELVEAISSSLNCIRYEINLNNYTETLLGDFISDYGDMVIILQQALANVRGEVK